MYHPKQAWHKHLYFGFSTGFDDSVVGKFLPRHHSVIKNTIFSKINKSLPST